METSCSPEGEKRLPESRKYQTSPYITSACVNPISDDVFENLNFKNFLDQFNSLEFCCCCDVSSANNQISMEFLNVDIM